MVIRDYVIKFQYLICITSPKGRAAVDMQRGEIQSQEGVKGMVSTIFTTQFHSTKSIERFLLPFIFFSVAQQL